MPGYMPLLGCFHLLDRGGSLVFSFLFTVLGWVVDYGKRMIPFLYRCGVFLVSMRTARHSTFGTWSFFFPFVFLLVWYALAARFFFLFSRSD